MNAIAQCDPKDNACYAQAEGLRYVSDTNPGYTRKLHGEHYDFYDAHGKRVTNKDEIARIRKLAIPPAYREVWICPYANGHLQATGMDARGRKQYRYHPDWRSVRDASKFQHMIAFGEALPQIRKTIAAQMAQPELTREKVLATIITLLEKTMIRVGNSEYAKSNKSYGLTTLRTKHIDVSADTIRFRFLGKSGKEWNLKFSDRRVAKIIRQCEELPGQDLFKYKDDTGTVHAVTSTDVNQYLQEITGEGFTAKDFRTWSGTVLAAIALQEYEKYDSEAQAKKQIIEAIEKTAKRLGNTPAICRKCYVHPEILDAYLNGSFVKLITNKINTTLRKKYASLSDEEIHVLAFLKRRLSHAKAVA